MGAPWLPSRLGAAWEPPLGAPWEQPGSTLRPPWDYPGNRRRPLGRPPLENTVKTNEFRRFCKCQGSAMSAPWEPFGSTLGAPCELPSLLGALASFLGAYLEALGTPREHPRSWRHPDSKKRSVFLQFRADLDTKRRKLKLLGNSERGHVKFCIIKNCDRIPRMGAISARNQISIFVKS